MFSVSSKKISCKVLMLVQFFFIVFSSRNFGQWVNLGPIQSADIVSIVGRGNEIYAGAYGRGVFKSTDNGDQWTLLNSGLAGLEVTCLLSSNSEIYAGTYYNGLYKLTDSTWTQVDLCCEYTVHALGACDDLLYAGINNSIYTSSDGNTWTKVYDFDKGVYATCFGFFCCTAYAGTNNSGVFVSSGGSSWTQINKGINLNVKCLFEYRQILYAGTETGIYYQDVVNTTDSSWTAFGGPTASVTSLMYYNKNIFAGTDGFGLYRYDWTNWYAINSLLNNKSVKALYNSALTLFAGTKQFGVYKSTDDGAVWYSSGKGIVQSNIRDLIVDDDKILVLNASEKGIFQTTNNGTTWTSITDKLKNSTGLYYIEKYDNKLYTGGLNGIFKTETSSINWLNLSMTSTNKSLLVDGNNMYTSTTDERGKTIILYSSDSGTHWNKSYINSIGYVNQFYKINNKILAAHQALGVLASDNNGVDWYETNSGLRYADPVNVWKFCSAGNYIFASTQNGIYRSTKNTSIFFWQNLIDLGADVYDMLAIDNKVFAASYGKGVFSTSDYGKTWVEINKGLTDSTLIALSSSSSNLYCASVNGVIFYRKLADLSILADIESEIQSEPQTFILNQNYPNPFNPSTVISYQLPKACYVQLKIYNSIGELVTTLVNEFKQAGFYNSTFNIKNFTSSSGIYFCKLTVDQFSKTIKMTLVK